MSPQQARVCVYCAAASTALSLATLVLVVIFSIGFNQTISVRDRQHDRDIYDLTKWAIAVYEKIDASECSITRLPVVPIKEKQP